MDNKKFKRFQIFSVIFNAILGVLLHFTYELSNNNLIVGAFSAVNESTWEHLKLLFIPMLISTIIGYFYIGKKTDKFLCARTIGIIIAMLFTIIFFYTYTGILGTNLSIVNIAIFFAAVIIGEYASYWGINSNLKCSKKIAITFLTLLLFAFICFTYFPPKIGLFQNPLVGGCGIMQKDSQG